MIKAMKPGAISSIQRAYSKMPSTPRLAAILAADVAGYSRLMGADEEGTLERLKALRRQLIDPKIKEHRGRIVKTTGDGVLAEFPSVVDAVRCAAEVQRDMLDREVIKASSLSPGGSAVREGPKVCRLPAGGKRIRTIGSAMRLHRRQRGRGVTPPDPAGGWWLLGPPLDNSTDSPRPATARMTGAPVAQRQLRRTHETVAHLARN